MGEKASIKPPVQDDVYNRNQVVNIINAVIEKVQQADFSMKETLAGELYELKEIIDTARQQIGSVRPSDIKNMHIPAATDELDAVIGATEEATDVIMDACEAIQEHVAETSEVEAIEKQITKIYEACSFQDITGQRIDKVVKTLKIIEEKVGYTLQVLDSKIPLWEGKTEGECKNKADKKSLLNGPQLPGQAVTQDDIDKLLTEFDN